MGDQMKFFFLNMLRLMKLLILITFLVAGYPYYAHAATGWCEPVNGTNQFSFNFNHVINNTTNNRPGYVVDPVYSWDLGGTYAVKCDCDASTINSNRRFKAIVPNMSEYMDIPPRKFFNLPNNTNLAVASDVYIGGGVNRFIQVPFVDLANTVTGSGCDSPETTADTGSRGHLALLVKKAFVGQTVIPNTTVMEIFSSYRQGSYSSIPVSRVNMSGTVTVPQSCRINDGQVIDVDYGTILNTALKTKGAGPEGFTAKVTQMSYVCTNISEGVKLSFTFKGQVSPSDESAIATNNNDIGVRLEDMSGGIITPNSGELPAQFDFASQSGSTSFRSYPVNTTGNIPESGPFSSTATISINIE